MKQTTKVSKPTKSLKAALDVINRDAVRPSNDACAFKAVLTPDSLQSMRPLELADLIEACGKKHPRHMHYLCSLLPASVDAAYRGQAYDMYKGRELIEGAIIGIIELAVWSHENHEGSGKRRDEQFQDAYQRALLLLLRQDESNWDPRNATTLPRIDAAVIRIIAQNWNPDIGYAYSIKMIDAMRILAHTDSFRSTFVQSVCASFANAIFRRNFVQNKLLILESGFCAPKMRHYKKALFPARFLNQLAKKH